jgi:Uma2 family endonuclease
MSASLKHEPRLFMTRAEYRAWSEEQPRGRFERINGEIIAMAAERVAHVRAKTRVWRALDQAIRAAGLPCEAFGDGVTVEVGEDSDFEPDCVVNCGTPILGDAVAAPNPVIVVEVLSPGTQSVDTGRKFPGYFSVPSIMHYLICAPDKPLIIHHRRGADGAIVSRIVTEGSLTLDPPGIAVTLADIYPQV